MPPSRYLLLLATAWLPCLVLGVSWCFVSPPRCVSWQQRPLALCGDLSLYTTLHALLGFSVLRHCGIHLRMIQDPLWDSAKALLYPLWYSCVLPLSVLCCLLAPLFLSPFVLSRVCACGSALPRFASPCTVLCSLLVRFLLRFPICCWLRCATKVTMCRLVVTKDLPALRWLLAASCLLLT